MRNFALLAALALSTLAPAARAACDGRDLSLDWPTETRAEIDAAAGAMAYGEGRLWEVEKNGNASVLFGTMHMGDAEMNDLPDILTDRLTHAKGLFVEVTLDEEKRMMRRLILNPSVIFGPPGKSLSASLPPDDMAKLSKAAAGHGIQGPQLDRVAPWFLLITLSNPACLMETAYTGAGEPVLDRLVEARATAAGVPVSGLEDVDEIFDLFGTLPWDRQVAMLRASLPTLHLAEDFLATARAMYLRGEIGAIAALSTTLMADEGGEEAVLAVEQLYDLLLRTRNERWIVRLAGPLAQGRQVIAVGALHLPGEDGLLRLLEAEGYTIRRLDG